MAIGDLQHSELPDNLLHEPKGASTAAEDTLYVANGAGSGEFKKASISCLDITIPSVSASSIGDITSTTSLSGASLAQLADGILNDIEAFVGIPQEITSMINKNASELLRLYNNQKEINDQVSAALTELENKINELLIALKGVGIIHD